MSWFVLVEMTLVGVMAFYLAYHVQNIFTRVKYRNVITAAIIIGFIILSLDDLIYFGFLVNACICLVIFDVIRFIL